MPGSGQGLPDLVIPNGTQVSNILQADRQYSDADGITLHAPTALDATTFTIQVSNDRNATVSSTWRTLQIGDPAADASPPLAGRSRYYQDLSYFAAFRLASSAPVAADRTWNAEKNYAVQM